MSSRPDDFPGSVYSFLQNHLIPGFIFDPVALAQECRTLKQPVELHAYALGLTMPDAQVRMFESALLPQAKQVTVHASPEGMRIILCTMQCAGHQHRLLIPAEGTATREWVRWCVENGELVLAVNIEERRQLAIVRSRLEPAEQRELQALLTHQWKYDDNDVARTLTYTALSMFAPPRVPSLLPAFSVQTVSVVLTVDFYVDRLKAKFWSAEANRPVH